MAIANDTSLYLTNGAGATRTFSYTVTGTNPTLVVGINFASGTIQAITGVTYGGVAMVKSDEQIVTLAGAYSLWVLAACPTGVNDIVVSSSNAVINFDGSASSYTGTAQSGQPDNHSTGSATAAGGITGTLTTVADNCWTVMGIGNSGGTLTAGAGTTMRVNNANGQALADSNGVITPAGSTSLIVTEAGSHNFAQCMVSLSPFTGTINRSLPLTGVGN